jgi:hypothetical protein
VYTLSGPVSRIFFIFFWRDEPVPFQPLTGAHSSLGICYRINQSQGVVEDDRQAAVVVGGEDPARVGRTAESTYSLAPQLRVAKGRLFAFWPWAAATRCAGNTRAYAEPGAIVGTNPTLVKASGQRADTSTILGADGVAAWQCYISRIKTFRQRISPPWVCN